MSPPIEWIIGTVGSLAFVVILPFVFGRRLWPWSIALLAVIIPVLYDLISGFALGSAFYLVYPVVAAAPLVVYLLVIRYVEHARLSSFGFRRPIDGYRLAVILAVILFGIYQALLWEPGLLLGLQLPSLPGPDDFGLFLFTIPLLVLGQEAVFRGYFLTKLAGRSPFRTALFVSSGFFALSTFNPFLVVLLNPSSLLQQIFLLLFVNFTLGILLGLYFYKSGWSLVGPWIFRTCIVGTSFLFPVAIRGISWTFEFVLELIAIAGVILLVFLWEREPRFESRHYLETPLQPRRGTLSAQARSSRHVAPAVAVIAVAVVVVGVSGPLGMITSSAPVHLLAIATPSMRPTLPPGTLILVLPIASASEIHVGEIIAYNAPYLSANGPVVHRVIRIQYNGTQPVFTTKGDANPSPDPRPVLFSQIVGSVAGNVPYLGILILDPEFTIAVLLVIVIAVLYRSTPGGMQRPSHRPVLPLREEQE